MAQPPPDWKFQLVFSYARISAKIILLDKNKCGAGLIYETWKTPSQKITGNKKEDAVPKQTYGLQLSMTPVQLDYTVTR